MKETSATGSRFFGLTMLSGFAGLTGVVALLVLSLMNEFQDTGQHARVQVENTSRLLEEHALATVQKVDLLLREVQRNVRPEDLRLNRAVSNSRRQELHALLQSQAESVPEVAVIYVTNSVGDHIYGSLDPVPHINVADRYHFTHNRDNPAAGLVITPPIVSRTTGKWAIVLSRRLNFEDGSFAGIIDVVMNMEYFQKFYRHLDLGKHGLVALYTRELHLAARHPPSEKDMGKVSNITDQAYIEKGIKQATYHTKSPLDGIERLHAFRQVGELPLFVFAGIAEDDYLADWRWHIGQYGLAAMIFGLVVIGSGLRQRRAESEQRRLSRELRAISDCNQALMRAADEQTLLNDICRIVCDEADYRMAWVGYAENDDAKTLRPVAWAGDETGYLEQAKLTWADTERGHGPSGTAIRSGESDCIQDFTTDPRAVPWRDNALQRGYRSSIALPLKNESAITFGVLNIYSAAPNAFTAAEKRLMEELSGDLAFGIMALRARIERNRAEEEVRTLNQELEARVRERTAQLEAANKELEEFSYSMSHDMRSPLRALDGFSKIVLDEHSAGLDDEGKRLLNVVRNNALRMGRLIDDILRFLGIGKRRMECNPVDVAKLAAEIFTELQADVPARRLRLEIGDLPTAWGDYGMIHLAVQNLLSNAVKFSPADGEALIEITGAAAEEGNVYAVTDHGIGFDMRYADKLFRVFEHLHPTSQYEGSGIGLAIVKRIVERHGGRVWAEGSVGEGATFSFTLPHMRTCTKGSGQTLPQR